MAVDHRGKPNARSAKAAHYPISGFVFGSGDNSAHVLPHWMRRVGVEQNIVDIDQAERLGVLAKNGETIDAQFFANLQNFVAGLVGLE